MGKQHKASNLSNALSAVRLPYTIVNILFAGLMLLSVIAVLFFNPNTYFPFETGWLLVVCSCSVAFMWLLHRLVLYLPIFHRAVEAIVVVAVLGLYILLQCYIGWKMRVYPNSNWDFGGIYTAAVSYVTQGDIPLVLPAGGQALYTFWCWLFAVCLRMGFDNYLLVAFTVNCILINVSVVFLYFTVRTAMNSRQALFFLLASILILPLTLYLPVFGAETFAMPFAIATVYFWCKGRHCLRQGVASKARVWMALLCVTAALGTLVQPFVVLVFLAAILDMLLTLKGKGRFVYAGGGVCIFLLALFLGGLFLSSRASLAGMQGPGNIGGLFATVFSGLRLDGAWDRLRGLFGDGLYKVTEFLERYIVEENNLHSFLVPDGSGYYITAYIAVSVQVSILVGLVISSIRAVLRSNTSLSFVRLALLVFVVLLCMGGGGPSTVMVYLPLLLLCALEALPDTLTAGGNTKNGLSGLPNDQEDAGEQNSLQGNAGPAALANHKADSVQ